MKGHTDMREHNNFNIRTSTQAKYASRSKGTFREISKISLGLAGVLTVGAIITNNINTTEQSFAEACTDSTSPYECNTTFQVNVKETLSVSVTTPTEWASGTPTYDSTSGTWSTDFLRNKVTVDVTANNQIGFTASMYASNSTSLTNTAKSTATLPTLSSSTTRDAFPVNHWGYSLDAASMGGNNYGETDAGNGSSNYFPLVSTSATPITIMNGTSTGTRNVYFGAKADLAQASGTYAGTVVISVVTGTINENTNPITPTNPATPETDTNQQDNQATYTGSTGTGATTGGGTNGTTVYTRRYSSPAVDPTTNTTATEVSEGDNTAAYPLGVTETTSSYVADNIVSGGNPLATVLATTAAASAVGGGFFFILAKRKKDDEEEDER